MKNNLKLFIDALLDYDNEDIGGADDAAMNLGSFDEPEAEEALHKAALEGKTDEMVLDVCGESLAEIWIRKNNFDKNKLEKLCDSSKRAALSIIKSEKPDWLL